MVFEGRPLKGKIFLLKWTTR